MKTISDLWLGLPLAVQVGVVLGVALTGVAIYVFGEIVWLKKRQKPDVEHFLFKIGAVKKVKVERMVEDETFTDGKPTRLRRRVTEYADVFPRWRYLVKWKNGRLVMAGIRINTKGFSIDENDLVTKKGSLQDATRLLFVGRPTTPRANRIEWRGVKKKAT